MNIYLSGYLDRNLGDDLMLKIIAYRFREHNFYISVKKEELFIPFENEPNMYMLKPDDKINFDMGLTVTGSGFIIRGVTSILYFLKEEFERRRLVKGLKNAVIGCNIGPYRGLIGKILVKWKVRSYDLISVRDKASYDFVKKYSKKSILEIHPDLVFSMPDEWIPDVECEGHLGISTYRSNFESNLHYYKTIAKTADKFIEQTKRKVLLFAFDVEQENDLCSAYTILSMMKHKEYAEIIAHTDDGSNILYNLKRCGGILTARFHMAVLATRFCLPFVPIAYSNKTVNALNDFGYEGEIFDIHSISEEKLLDAIYNIEPFKNSKILQEQARGHYDCLRQWMK